MENRTNVGGNPMSFKDNASKAKINKSSLLKLYGIWWVNIPKPESPERFSEDDSTLLVEDGKWYITLRNYLYDLIGSYEACADIKGNYVVLEDVSFDGCIFERLSNLGLHYCVDTHVSMFDSNNTELAEESRDRYLDNLRDSNGIAIHLTIFDMVE